MAFKATWKFALLFCINLNHPRSQDLVMLITNIDSQNPYPDSQLGEIPTPGPKSVNKKSFSYWARSYYNNALYFP